MALRVLHVFPTFAAGGSQRRTVDLVRGLGRAVEHAVLALDGVATAAELVPEGALRLVEPPRKAGSLATARWIGRLLARERPQLLCTYNFGAVDALLAARWRGGPPAIHHEDGFHPDEARGQKRRRVWLRRVALPAARRVVVVSRNLERLALERWKQPADRVLYLPNGIDLERFSRAALPRDARARFGLDRAALVVGCVGHLRTEKNVARLLAAAALARSRGVALDVLVVGDGPERKALEALARVPLLAGHVHFAGHHTDPTPAYGAMDVLALSSDTEQMPLALLEAMAASLPVVSTDVGDVAQIVPAEQRPFVVPLGTATDGTSSETNLAAALERLASDRELRARLGRANRERAAAFDRRVMLDAYRELYATVSGVASPGTAKPGAAPA